VRATPLGIRLFARPVTPVATTTTIWNGSSDTPASSADWLRTNGNLTAERTSTSAGFWAMLRGSTAKTSGTLVVTVDVVGGGIGPYIGLDTGVETQDLGHDGTGHSIGYEASGGIFFAGGSAVGSPVASYTTGDVIKIVRSGANVSFYKNNVLQLTVDTSSVTYGPVTGMSGAAYPAASNGNGTGTKLTLDASAW
jgi:hypothetical protein